MNIFRFLVCGKSEPETKEVKASNLNKAILKAQKDNPGKDVYYQSSGNYSCVGTVDQETCDRLLWDD